MKKYLKIILISITIILILIISFTINFYLNKNKVKAQEVKTEIIEKKENNKDEPIEIKKFRVDIKGYVNIPGVYELEENQRVIDVINIAGGLKENADTSIINLSKKITDEMVIIIYSKEEIDKYKEKLNNSKEIVKEIQKEIVCPDTINNACINNQEKIKVEEKNNKEESEGKETNGKVSINTATKEELMTINGIGEGKAESIIKYREENGNFETIDDIKNVSGIGNSIFEKIKEFITV